MRLTSADESERKGFANASFGTFTVSDKLRDNVGKFPPLALPHLEINTLLPHDDLLLQDVLCM